MTGRPCLLAIGVALVGFALAGGASEPWVSEGVDGGSIHNRGYDRGYESAAPSAPRSGYDPAYGGDRGPQARPNWGPPFPLGSAADRGPREPAGAPSWDPAPWGSALGAGPAGERRGSESPSWEQGANRQPSWEQPAWDRPYGGRAPSAVSERGSAWDRDLPSGGFRDPDRTDPRAQGAFSDRQPSDPGAPPYGITRYDEQGYAWAPDPALPGWHFRGDPEPQDGAPWGRRWGGGTGASPDPYRFRPLNERERERMGAGSWSESPRGVRPDPFEPGSAFGFEPRPWQGP